jgi:excisionase family DNA binding protein
MTIGESKDRENEERIEELLTTKQVADLFKVSERHIQNLVRRGEFPKPINLGRRVRFRARDIRRFLNGKADEGGLMNQAI